jgi:hypothetical protein
MDAQPKPTTQLDRDRVRRLRAFKAYRQQTYRMRCRASMLLPQGIEPPLKRRLLDATPGGKLFVRFYSLASLEFINQLLPEPSAFSLSHARTLFERHSLGQDVQNRTVTLFLESSWAC